MLCDRIKEKEQRRKVTIRKDGIKNDTRDTPKVQSNLGTTSTDKKHCFNYGSKHDIKGCINVDKGPKCFRCNDYEHIASSSKATAGNVSVYSELY